MIELSDTKVFKTAYNIELTLILEQIISKNIIQYYHF